MDGVRGHVHAPPRVCARAALPAHAHTHPSPPPTLPHPARRFDDEGPPLFQVDPSGAYFGWRASSIGRNFTNAKTFLEKRYSEELELEDAIHTALLTLREGFEGEMTSTNIELAVVGADRTFRILSAAEVADYLAEAD